MDLFCARCGGLLLGLGFEIYHRVAAAVQDCGPALATSFAGLGWATGQLNGDSLQIEHLCFQLPSRAKVSIEP